MLRIKHDEPFFITTGKTTYRMIVFKNHSLQYEIKAHKSLVKRIVRGIKRIVWGRYKHDT